jgi:lipid-A-disaccharide synthase
VTAASRPILLLTQGHAGDRLGAALAPALRERFPERELVGIGGEGMRDEGVRLLARADRISAMGWSGLLPAVPQVLRVLRQVAAATRDPLPACIIAVDVWQPLRPLHRIAPHLQDLPHLCYLPPGPNFIGRTRVHAAASRVFASIVTPFPHQARLFQDAGGRVRTAAHVGLERVRREYRPLEAGERESLLALLPGSRALEVRYSLQVQLEAARLIRKTHTELEPVVCCAGAEVARRVEAVGGGVRISRDARDVLARARFALVCSGTAALEAAVLGCPGVVTYHGSPLQRWEWHRFHVPKLARLRAEGIAAPYISMPNILAGEELYPELLDVPADAVARAALGELAGDLEGKRAKLDGVAAGMSWEDAGAVIADEVERLIDGGDADEAEGS